METKTLSVAAIANGSVIDHIPAGQALLLIHFLGLSQHKKRLSVGLNYPSSSTGTKDLIKIEDIELTETDRHHIAIFAPQATINIINNYEVVRKSPVTLPSVIRGIAVCPNSLCITNSEPIETAFSVRQNLRHTFLTCKYCRHTYSQDEITRYRKI